MTEAVLGGTTVDFVEDLVTEAVLVGTTVGSVEQMEIAVVESVGCQETVEARAI